MTLQQNKTMIKYSSGPYLHPVLQGLPNDKSRSAQHGPHGYDGKPYCWQKKWEMETLLHLYEHREPEYTLELGTAGGGTLYWWLKTAMKWSDTYHDHDDKYKSPVIVAVDTYSPERGWYGEKDNRHLYPDWYDKWLVDLHIVKGVTYDLQTIDKVTEISPKYDFIFIDAGHKYEEVSAEWEAYRYMVNEGGLVVLCDILNLSDGPSLCEVDKLWTEIRHAGYLTQELVAVEGKEAYGMGLVYF